MMPWSHPVWVCGLKLKVIMYALGLLVTPCMGVWIETELSIIALRRATSHPVWVCGLKL